MKLSKEEMFEAVRTGAKDAILEMTESEDIIRTEQFMEAIKEGVKAAIWNIANNNTDTPCGDFYHAIKEGVKDSVNEFNICKCGEKSYE